MLVSFIGSAQNVNLVIQVNEKLVVGSISGMYLLLDSGPLAKQIPVSYVPGDLLISKAAWTIINSDTTNKLSLHFNYNTYLKKNEETAFYVNLTREQLTQPYLLLNIYDFRDKKYRKWYQWHTDKNFLAELRYPNSGVYIRKG